MAVAALKTLGGNLDCPSPEDAARDFARQTAVHFGALTLTFPDGHTERFGDAEADVGRTVVFLAGPDSKQITGCTIGVDGGSAML